MQTLFLAAFQSKWKGDVEQLCWSLVSSLVFPTFWMVGIVCNAQCPGKKGLFFCLL